MAPQLLDDALAYDVVRQAAEGLGAYDVAYTAVNQFQHFAGEEPSLAGLVAQGHKALGHLCQLIDIGRRSKMFAGGQLLLGCFAEIFQKSDSRVAQVGGGALGARCSALKLLL